MVSDKQNNLTKLHDDWYLDIPHQYCHFHFLQNIWNHIEVKDCSLHQKLSKGVKHLAILSASKQKKTEFDGYGKLGIREVFQKVEIALRRAINTRNKTFDILRGMKTFDTLTDYALKMEFELKECDPQIKGISILIKTKD